MSTFTNRPNMSEQEILTDLLSSEKQLMKEYASECPISLHYGG